MVQKVIKYEPNLVLQVVFIMDPVVSLEFCCLNVNLYDTKCARNVLIILNKKWNKDDVCIFCTGFSLTFFKNTLICHGATMP